jgi:hypothetical protein
LNPVRVHNQVAFRRALHLRVLSQAMIHRALRQPVPNLLVFRRLNPVRVHSQVSFRRALLLRVHNQVAFRRALLP